MLSFVVATAILASGFFGRDNTEARIRRALEEWRPRERVTITLEFTATDGWEDAAAFAETWQPRPRECVIWLKPLYYAQSDRDRQHAIAHEVGHCLGLPHAPGGVMDPATWEHSAVTAVDRARLSALWDGNRAVLPMLTGP